MRGARRRHMAGAVGRGRDDRTPECVEQCVRDRMRGHAHRDGVEPGERKIGDAATGCFASTSVSGPGQNAAASFSAAAVKTPARARGIDIGDVRDQRIERRPSLGRIEPRNGLAVTGIGTEAVDGFGRERDQPAGGKAARRGLDRLVVGG